MFRPEHDVASETHVGPGLKTSQSALLDQVVAELTESKSGWVVAKVRAGYHAQVD